MCTALAAAERKREIGKRKVKGVGGRTGEGEGGGGISIARSAPGFALNRIVQVPVLLVGVVGSAARLILRIPKLEYIEYNIYIDG